MQASPFDEEQVKFAWAIILNAGLIALFACSKVG
jgi:hypothetical protein